MAEKFGIIASLEPLEKGDQFEEFPLHVTIMTWFAMPHERSFLNQLQNFALRQASQEVTGGEEALFGPDKDIRVRKLGRVGSLHTMHNELLRMITMLDGEVWSGGYVGDDYVPHVTYQGDRGLEKDEAVTLERLQLIRGDEAGPRTVVADLGLLKEHRY